MPFTAVDRQHMLRALRLAERGRGRTAPNPVVGAVVVRGGRVVGQGWHRALGGPHAELEALGRAGRRSRGATLYVTLEPCAHHGRTPPCTEAILSAGIARCVVAVRDPHEIVNGRGLRRLRSGGVSVEVGLCGAEARALLGGYLLAHGAGRPRVTWKVAASLDGRIADAGGRSRWITDADARRAGHALRAGSDAIVIGSGTARADDPRLTVRPERLARLAGAARAARAARGAPQPLRVVCDTRLSLPVSLRLFSPPLARGTVVACSPRASAARARALEDRGVAVWRLPASRDGVSPRALARRLVAAGRHEVLLEGGATLGRSWMRAGLVDRLALFAAPLVLGDGLAWCGSLGRVLATAPRGRLERIERAGDGALLVVDWGGRLMFTGIVEELGRVASVEERPAGRRFWISATAVLEGLGVGDSVAHAGCCLTVVAIADGRYAVEAVPETLRLTTLGEWREGDPVNLERSLRLEQRLGGHLVQGHVDGVGEVAGVQDEGDGRRVALAIPPALRRFVAGKGSLAVDGVSLTVAALTDAGCEIAYIPHTLAVTTAGAYRPGRKVNLEVDLLARYLARLLDDAGSNGRTS